MDAQPELFVVVGPNGSGKSSAIYETQINDKLIFVNPDDIAAQEYSDVQDPNERDMRAWLDCSAKRELLLAQGVTFGFETVGSHSSKVEFMKNAQELGYKVTLLFVATENPSINIERIAQRHARGGHTVPDQKVVSRYHRTLELLKDYFKTADEAFIWDNSETSNSADCRGMKELVRKVNGEIEVLEAAQYVRWVNDYLLDLL